MAKKTTIDEELMREMIGSQKSVLDNPNASVKIPDPELGDTTAARRRRSTIPDFEENFLSLVDIPYRASIYVSADTKRKVLEVVKKIGRERMTLTSYVENILRHHLELYKEEINRLHKERNSNNIL